MARGDIKWFAQALHDLGNKIHDLDADDIRMGVVTNAVTPAINTAAPHWGGTGTTNLATNQVPTGTAYTGPVTLTGETWALTAAGADFRLTNVTIAQDAGGGFTTGYWGVIYNNTDANKRALAYVDLGGPVGNQAGPIDFDWNGASGDVLRLAQA
ncbi:MAG: hypothetical protein KJ023_00035 [Burkholderiaceae bacterium]|nr:hypothetical protein [Burkholderiaceae bacterium]